MFGNQTCGKSWLKEAFASSRTFVFLFDLDGKATHVKSNLNAIYLRALFSPENLAERIIHLDGNDEFHVRKGTDIPRDGKPAHFRQRFTEDTLFVTLRLTFNAQMVATGTSPQAFGDLTRFISSNPATKFIPVPSRPPRQYGCSRRHPRASRHRRGRLRPLCARHAEAAPQGGAREVRIHRPQGPRDHGRRRGAPRLPARGPALRG